jgi:phosphoglucosamine mutase
VFPLDVTTVRRLGAALARALRQVEQPVRFLAGRDTRESGSWIERELAFGVRSQGGSLTSAGIIPTPAVAYLTPRTGYTAGVVISASHNPFEDNGIKVFSGAAKSSPKRSNSRSRPSSRTTRGTLPSRAEPAEVRAGRLRSAYVGHLLEILPPPLRSKQLRIVVDCGNGATRPWRRACSRSSACQRVHRLRDPTAATSTWAAVNAPQLLAGRLRRPA